MADNALIFLSLCFWQHCLYISSAIFIAVLPISFVHYIHWTVALMFCTLYPCLYEVLAEVKTFCLKGKARLSWNSAALEFTEAVVRRYFSK